MTLPKPYLLLNSRALLGQERVRAKCKSPLNPLLPQGTTGTCGPRDVSPWCGYNEQASSSRPEIATRCVHQREGSPSLTTFFQEVCSRNNVFQNFSIGGIRCEGSTGSRELSSWSFSHRLLSCWSCCSRSFSSGVYPDMSPLVPRQATERPRPGSCHLVALSASEATLRGRLGAARGYDVIPVLPPHRPQFLRSRWVRAFFIRPDGPGVGGGRVLVEGEEGKVTETTKEERSEGSSGVLGPGRKGYVMQRP